ncbi:NUDIX domain-containing protein [Candidatus Woesearchaeota archaeon]|nr:NUDIX domain-containing protein [Candidatus Woesearchaeota archaeon]
MQEKEALIDTFDENGKVVAHKLRKDINKTTDILKAVYIILENNHEEVYLTLSTGELWKGKWGVSAAGIVRHNETPLQAAQRTLKRELGIIAELQETHSGFYTFGPVKRWMWAYKAQTRSQPKPNTADVEEGTWMTHTQAEKLIKSGRCMPTLEKALR